MVVVVAVIISFVVVVGDVRIIIVVFSVVFVIHGGIGGTVSSSCGDASFVQGRSTGVGRGMIDVDEIKSGVVIVAALVMDEVVGEVSRVRDVVGRSVVVCGVVGWGVVRAGVVVVVVDVEKEVDVVTAVLFSKYGTWRSQPGFSDPGTLNGTLPNSASRYSSKTGDIPSSKSRLMFLSA
ncbi:hypothetical protein Aduo_018603 [Ancylostoma duodenale]